MTEPQNSGDIEVFRLGRSHAEVRALAGKPWHPELSGLAKVATLP